MSLDYDSMNKEELINHIKKLKREKKYGLIWEDKEEKIDSLLDKHYPVFKHIQEKDITTDSTKGTNFLIEGENLHSLTLLNITHKKRLIQF